MKMHISNKLHFLILALLMPVLAVAVEVIEKDLGLRNPSFGSAGQAAAMLALINEHPHQRKYQVSYKTDDGTVFLECDIAMDTITRVHKRKNSTGTAEKWQGEALYRLKTATKGGSLNDTRKGKSMGTITNF
jgi:hypothetical protein